MGNFANVFKHLRNKENFSQQDIADRLGVSKSAISMYENGNREPDIETLEKIADFFNVDMDYLIGRQNDKRTVSVSPVKSYDDVEQLIARNGKQMSKDQKLRLIQLLSEIK